MYTETGNHALSIEEQAVMYISRRYSEFYPQLWLFVHVWSDMELLRGNISVPSPRLLYLPTALASNSVPIPKILSGNFPHMKTPA